MGVEACPGCGMLTSVYADQGNRSHNEGCPCPLLAAVQTELWLLRRAVPGGRADQVRALRDAEIDLICEIGKRKTLREALERVNRESTVPEVLDRMAALGLPVVRDGGWPA